VLNECEAGSRKKEVGSTMTELEGEKIIMV
jgi:hypothetical protein